MHAKLFIDDSIKVSGPSQLQELAEKEIPGIDYFFNIMDAQFYYVWGNEPAGFYSIGMYDEKEVYQSLGYGKIEDVRKRNLPFNNPHS